MIVPAVDKQGRRISSQEGNNFDPVAATENDGGDDDIDIDIDTKT